MIITKIIEQIEKDAKYFGAKTDKEFCNSYVLRNNTGSDALNDNGAYFGLISPDEEASGPYHDFSLVVFPTDQNKAWLICIGIGSSGFKNDYELATFPGLRRMFSKLVNEEGFCKSDFSDIETSLPKAIIQNDKIAHIRNTIKRYSKLLPVCQIIDNPDSDDGEKIIKAFTAAYAKMRDWATNNDNRKNISEALKPFAEKNENDDEKVVKNLLLERKYVILQGAPGTGKTRLAKVISNQLKAKTFFTQFHAETSYSDFIYGIRPDTDNGNLNYKEYDGIFPEAIEYARNNPDKKVVLIIDEINRANLSNVLGPVFYLFEHKMDSHDVDIEITPKLKINKLPDNLYVIATMNTADRSLAVIDFALRRRFAWYDLKPQTIKSSKFYKDDFLRIQEIFNWYGSSSELTLMPGQGYFIADTNAEMESRIRYEIYPLIKEYLQEGLLQNAKEEFNNYFTTRIKLSLFE